MFVLFFYVACNSSLHVLIAVKIFPGVAHIPQLIYPLLRAGLLAVTNRAVCRAWHRPGVRTRLYF